MIWSWLKKHLGLVSLAVGVIGVIAFFFVSMELHTVTMESALHLFRQAHKPVVEINLTSIYGGNEQFQILHPLLDVKKWHDDENAPNCAGSDGGSEFAEGKFLEEREPTKRAELDDFLAGKINLPMDFLTNPPLIDGVGHSYAYLLMRYAPKPFNEREWVVEHLSFFKISELSEVLKKYQITDLKFEVLSHFNEQEMEDIIKGEPLVLTQDFLLFKNESRFGFSPLSYWVYDIRDLQADLRSSPYELSAYMPSGLCLEQLGNACWNYSAKTAIAKLYQYSLFFLVLLGLGLLACLGAYLRSAYERNREQNKRRLALQVLSHEFRTPVSSLLLMIDQLSKKSNDEDLVTRISGEVFRLQRVVEMSQIYLKAEGHKTQVRNIEIPSINTWVTDFIEDEKLKIECTLLSRDQTIYADPFWLKYALSNLVQNALSHGKPPVGIRLEVLEERLKIIVEDWGTCDFDNLNEMTEAFVKSDQSQGMGLGLNITKYILDDLGTELQFSKNPTAFTLFFDVKG